MAVPRTVASSTPKFESRVILLGLAWNFVVQAQPTPAPTSSPPPPLKFAGLTVVIFLLCFCLLGLCKRQDLGLSNRNTDGRTGDGTVVMDEPARAFIMGLGHKNRVAEGLAGHGVKSLEELVNPKVVTDAMLESDSVGMNRKQVANFRRAADALAEARGKKMKTTSGSSKQAITELELSDDEADTPVSAPGIGFLSVMKRTDDVDEVDMDEELGEPWNSLDLAGDLGEDTGSGEEGGHFRPVAASRSDSRPPKTWIEEKARITGNRGTVLASKLKAMGYETAEDFRSFNEEDHFLRYDVGMEKDEIRKFMKAVAEAKGASGSTDDVGATLGAPAKARSRPPPKKGKPKPKPKPKETEVESFSYIP